MKFCKYCGKQLEDNAFCDCEQAAAERAANSAPQQTAQPQQMTQPEQAAQFQQAAQPQQTAQFQQAAQPQQAAQFQQTNPYSNITANTPQSNQPNKVAIAFKNLPTVFISYFKNSGETLKIAKENKDIATACIYSGIFFIATLLYCMFFMLGISSYMFSFPKSLLTAFVMTLIIGVLYIGVEFASIKIFNKEADAKQCIIDSFVGFALHSVPVSICFILAGLFSFITIYVTLFLVIFAVVYLMITLLGDIQKAIGPVTDKFGKAALIALFVGIALTIAIFVALRLTIWQVMSGFSGLGSSILSGLGSSISNGLSSLY